MTSLPDAQHWARPAAVRYHAEAARVEHRPVKGDVTRLLDDMVRRQLVIIAQDARHPGRAFTEACGRSERRPLGTITIARALIAARNGGVARERLLTIAAAIEAFVLALYDGSERLRDAWCAECREQAEADVAQAAVFPERSDARLDAAIEETIQDLAAKRALLATLIAARHTGSAA